MDMKKLCENCDAKEGKKKTNIEMKFIDLNPMSHMTI